MEKHKKIYTVITAANRWGKGTTAVEAGKDPADVKLIFSDALDDFSWVVAPQSFTLKRNKSRPLLSQYNISLTWVDNYATARPGSPSVVLDVKKQADAQLSLLESLKMINEFLLSGALAFVGELRKSVESFVRLTAAILKKAQEISRAVVGPITLVTDQLFAIAGNLSRAGANIAHTVQTIVAMPDIIKARFSRLASAFTNAFCVLRNAFNIRRFLPNYDDLYGASNCSSTAGGKAISRYNTENPFPAMYPVESPHVSVSGRASGAVSRLASYDPVLAPMSGSMMSADMGAVASGVIVA